MRRAALAAGMLLRATMKRSKPSFASKGDGAAGAAGGSKVGSGGVAAMTAPRSAVAFPDRTSTERTDGRRSEENTSEIQSLMRRSSAVCCMKKNRRDPQKKLKHQNITQS